MKRIGYRRQYIVFYPLGGGDHPCIDWGPDRYLPDSTLVDTLSWMLFIGFMLLTQVGL